MSRYEKIQSGSGMHGVKYEVNFLLYCLLKSYQTQEHFQLSYGEEGKRKTDDIILENGAYKIYAQAKHIENETKKITSRQLFDRTGKFSLWFYLEKVYKIFKKLVQDNQNQLVILLEDPNTLETTKRILAYLLNQVSDKVNTFNEDLVENIIMNLQKINDEKISELLNFFQNTRFCLITNITPNEEVTKSNVLCSSSSKPLPNFEDFEESYNFETNIVTNELFKFTNNSQIPKWFVKIFLENFFLIKITDQALKKNILKLLPLYLDKPVENSYNSMFRFVEEWQSNTDGISLSQNEIMNREFIQELKGYENLVDFRKDLLLNSLNRILVIKTSRYLLIMAVLQNKCGDEGFEQALFVNPFSHPDKQLLAIKAFLKQKYTHLICVLRKNTAELKNSLADILLKIQTNNKSLKNKKVIVFIEEDVEMNDIIGNEVITDDEWFNECKLRIDRTPTSFNKTEKFYINRQFSDVNNVDQSETVFIENVIINANNFVIISDSPGMGKTTVLSNLAMKINQEYNFWALIIQLNGFTDLLEIHSKCKTVPQLNEFIEILIKGTIERQICEIPNILILMVDGFDEISPDYKIIVTEFLKNTRTMKNVKMTIVTTRRHLKEHLEEQLKVSAFSLKQLTDDDVCSLICKFGDQSIDLVKQWYDSIGWNDHDFFKIPLHAKMFAELFPQLGSESCNNGLKINLYEIYNSFLNKKNDIFIKEKCRCRGNIISKSTQNQHFCDLLHTCTQLSVQLTHPEKSLKKLGLTKTVANTPDDDLCSSGILEIYNTSLRFVHMSFQEFFHAKWVILLIFDRNRDKFEIAQILEEILNTFYYSTRFLEAFLEKHWNTITDEMLENFGGILSKNNLLNYFLYKRPFIFRLSAEKCKNIQLLDDYFCHIINKYFDYESTISYQYQEDFIVSYFRKQSNMDERYFRALSVFHVAIYKGDLKLVRRIFDEDIVSIHDKTSDGKSVLFIAIKSKNVQLIDYLVSKGANIYEKMTNGRNLLHNAVSSEYSISLKELIRKEANITQTRLLRQEWLYNIPNDRHNLSFATLNTVDFVKYLISKGININEKTNDGRNVLHYAASKGNLELCKYLVNEGINIHEKTKDGRNVLHIAISLGKVNLIDFLFDNGGITNETTNESENHHHGTSLELVKFLVNEDINIHEKTEDGRNVLHFAVSMGEIHLVKYLIGIGANVNELTNEGENMLHFAAFTGNIDLVKYLVDKEVNIHGKTKDGKNILHFAAYKGNAQLAKYLMSHLVDIYENANNGRNILHFALNGGNVEFIKYLINEEIITYDKRNNCEYLLNFALSRGNLSLVEYLIKNGQTLTRWK